MAVIVSDNRNPNYNGSISTANGFYRAIYSRLACTATPVSLASAINIPITFTGAGNLMGLAVWLTTTHGTTTGMSVKVELQEFVGGTTWTARTSKTLSPSEIMAGGDTNRTQFHSDGYITGFKFDTPYAVNTTASIWRFQISQTGSSGSWNMRMSAAGVHAIVAWDDTLITFTSNQDQFISIDRIILNSAVTLLGALFTGDTTNQIAGWIGSGRVGYSNEDACTLTWADAPVSSYTVTVKGRIYYGSNGGFRAGTSALPIPSSAMGHLTFTAATLGTNNNSLGSGFFNWNAGGGTSAGGHMFLYGEVPAYEDTRLEADAEMAQRVIVTQDITGWVAGDRLVIGGCDDRGSPDPTVFVIASVAVDGKTITLTADLNTKRRATRSLFRLNGYGFKMSANNTNGLIHRNYSYDRWVMRGVEFININWQTYITAPFSTSQPWDLSHCSHNSTLSYGGVTLAYPCFYGSPNGVNPTYGGTFLDHINVVNGNVITNMYTLNGAGIFRMTNCIIFDPHIKTSLFPATSGVFTYSNNRHEGGTTSFVRLAGFRATIRDNEFWGNNSGGSSGNGAVVTYGLFQTSDMGGNKFDNNTAAITFTNSGPSLDNKSLADEFGVQKANSTDLYMVVGSLHQWEFENFKGNITYYWWVYLYHGSSFRLISANQVEGADRIILEEGDMYKCGTGLADTTKHNENYCLKLVSKADVADVSVRRQIPITWTQKIPTENIQNQSMMIGIWVKIANSAFWTTGGTYQMPRLVVDYDNGTVTYSEALQNTDWQFVSVPFTPITTYGEITASVTGQSQAAAANSAFYVAEMSVLYPAGHNIEMGKFNTWSSALPTMPSISTTISAGDVWAVDPASFGAGTIGESVNKIKGLAGLIPAAL